MHRDSEDRTRVTLSTGHEVTLPLELEFAVGGVTVPARRSRLESILPDELSALALAPGVGCVTFVGIRYHRVGGERGSGVEIGAEANRADTGSESALEPYEEFAVIVPAVRGSRTDLPLAQAIDGEVGGYVHWLPVTTEPSVALGREIWGYPKERADITVSDEPAGIRATVDAEGLEERLRLEVPGSRTRDEGSRYDRTLWSYTTKDGNLIRTRARIRGRLEVGLPTDASLEIGDDLQARLGCWNRPLARLYGSWVRAWLHDGTPVAETR